MNFMFQLKCKDVIYNPVSQYWKASFFNLIFFLIRTKKDFNIFEKFTIMFAIVGDSVLKNECKESIVLEIIKDKKYQP